MNNQSSKRLPQVQQQQSSQSSVVIPYEERVKTLRKVLEKCKPQIKIALPSHLDVERLNRIVMTAVQKNPGLLDCTQTSVIAAVIQCAQLGLEPDAILGEAWLVPYWNRTARPAVKECQFQVGYKGLMKLARQSGEVGRITARIVHEKDHFEFEFGLEDRLSHRPTNEENPGPVTHAYSVAKLKGGDYCLEVMTVGELRRIAALSKDDRDSAPWKKFPEAMMKKSVIRQMCKWLPRSTNLATAVALDERAEADLSQDIEQQVFDQTESLQPPAIDQGQGGQIRSLDQVVERERAREAAETERQDDDLPPYPTDENAADF